MLLTFNAVELCVVTITEKPWSRAREVCKALEYNKLPRQVVRQHCSRENYFHEWQFARHVSETKSVDWPKDSQKLHLYINEERMIELLVGR